MFGDYWASEEIVYIYSAAEVGTVPNTLKPSGRRQLVRVDPCRSRVLRAYRQLPGPAPPAPHSVHSAARVELSSTIVLYWTGYTSCAFEICAARKRNKQQRVFY